MSSHFLYGNSFLCEKSAFDVSVLVLFSKKSVWVWQYWLNLYDITIVLDSLSRQPYIFRGWRCQGNHISWEYDVVKATIYLQRMTLSRQQYIVRGCRCQGNHISSEDDVVKATIYLQRMALSRQPYNIFRGWRCQANYISSEDGVVKATIYRQRMTLWQGIPYTLNCLASCERWPHTTMRDSLFYYFGR